MPHGTPQLHKRVLTLSWFAQIKSSETSVGGCGKCQGESDSFTTPPSEPVARALLTFASQC